MKQRGGGQGAKGTRRITVVTEKNGEEMEAAEGGLRD